MQLSEASREQLTSVYKELRSQRNECTARMSLIKDEIAKRDGAAAAAKKLAGISPQEREAMLALLQTDDSEDVELAEDTDLEPQDGQ